MDEKMLRMAAQELYEAEKTAKPVVRLCKRFPDMSMKDAYTVQLLGMELRQQQGHKVIGRKIGLTSKAMQEAFGVYEPDYGYIADYMMVMEGEPLSMGKLRLPKVEAEIAFVLRDKLAGPGITLTDVMRATEGVIPALEIINTRYEDWKITVEDSIADGASIGKVVLGDNMVKVQGFDLRYTGMVLEKNGEIISTAAGAATLGHPANAVVWLANKLADYGQHLAAGDIIISGALTAACSVAAGDAVRATFDRLGSVGIRFAE